MTHALRAQAILGMVIEEVTTVLHLDDVFGSGQYFHRYGPLKALHESFGLNAPRGKR